MPPPNASKKKKKGRAPKHQNSFAFKHNPKSKKTDKILASPNVGVCKRCYDKIEWRKKYRKYKPRTQPGKCNLCFQKNVMAAYHTICTKCAGSDKAIAAMEKKMGSGSTVTTAASTGESEPAAAENNATPVDEHSNEEKEATTETSSSVAADVVVVASSNKPNKNRHLRVCAMCTTSPAQSKYSNAHPDDMDIIDQLQSLEETLDSGISEEDGHKLTLREVKGVERKIEKLQDELKERRKIRSAQEEGEDDGEQEGEEDDEIGEDNGEEGAEDDNNEEEEDSVESNNDPSGEMIEDDPFLLATGGKALVGEEYQKMILAREQQK